MTNQAISSVRSSPASVFLAGPSAPKNSSKMGNIALANIPKKEEKGFIAGCGNTLLAYTIRCVLSLAKKWDDKILPSILTDEAELTLVVKEIAPQLLKFISPLLPDEIKSFLEDQSEVGQELVDRLLIRIITNLSLSLFAEELQQKIVNGEEIPGEEKIPAKELAGKLFNKLIHLVGEDFNAIDEKVLTQKEKLSALLFRPTLEKIYDLIFPPGDVFRGWKLEQYFPIKETLVSKGADGCLDLYKSVLKWMKGEESPVAPSKEDPIDITPLQDGIGRFVKCLNGELREKWQKKDSALFERLTGSGDLSLLMEKISPKLYEQLSPFFPKELALIFEEDENQKSLEESTKIFLLHAIVSLAKEVFHTELEQGTQVTPEHLIERGASHFAAKIRAQFEMAHQKQAKGESVTASDFAPISEEIIKIFLPEAGADGEYQWLHSLMERRQKELAEPLHQVLLSLYLSQPAHGKVEEYKNRLKVVFGEERGADAAVDQLSNLSSNLALLLRDQIASPLKDSQKVFEELEQDPLAGKMALGVQEIFEGADSQLSWFQKQMQQALEYMIFRSIVHFFEKVPPEDRHPPGQLLMLLIQKILKIGMNHLPKITENLERQKGRILLEVRSKLSNPESASYIPNKEKRKIAIEKELMKRLEVSGALLVQPFLDESMGLFFENEQEVLEDQIPFIGEFNNPLCKQVRTFLAEQFSKMLVVTTSWMQDRKTNETRLGELYRSKNPMKLCNVLGHMAREGLSNGLREKNEVWTELLMPYIKPYFCPEGASPENTDIDNTCLQNMIQGFFLAAGTTDSPVIEKLMDFTGNFIETSLLRLMADFSKRFKTMEEVNADPPPFSPVIEESKTQWSANAPDKSLGRQGDFTANKKILKSLIKNPEITDEQLFAFIKFVKIKSDGKFLKSLENVFQKARGILSSDFIYDHEIKNESLMEGIVLHLFGLVKGHFEVIGRIKKGKNDELTRDQLISEFQRAGQLHPAVLEGEGKKDFYKQLSPQIFQVIDISDKSPLPIPDFMKKWLWNLVEGKLVPMMLGEAIDAARNPSNLNKIFVAALQDSVEVVRTDRDSGWARLLPNEDQQLESYAPRFKDAYQTKLQERIGGVVDAVIQPRGKSIPRCLLNMKMKGKRFFHNKTAAAIGQAVRSILRDEHDHPVPALELLNIAMGSMADSIVEVEWNDREKKIVYPKTEFDGKKAAQENGAVEYVERPNLAKFFPKTEQEKVMAAVLEKKERIKAEKEFPYYLRKKISKEAKRFIRDPFLQGWKIFEAKFKAGYPKLGGVVCSILTIFVKPIFYAVVFLLDMCIWGIVNAVLKLISKQIEKYAKDTNADVYDNVIYPGIEFMMGKVVEGMGQVYVEDEGNEEFSGEAGEEEEVEAAPVK
jgi:hypothetical protein